MSNIFSFEDHTKKHRFDKDIIEVLSDENPLYEYGQDKDLGIAYLHFNKYIYIFFKYIPRGNTTDLPNLRDSLSGVEQNNRYSPGEWVVEKIFVLNKDEALKYFPIIYSKTKESGWIGDFRSRIEIEK